MFNIMFVQSIVEYCESGSFLKNMKFRGHIYFSKYWSLVDIYVYKLCVLFHNSKENSICKFDPLYTIYKIREVFFYPL